MSKKREYQQKESRKRKLAVVKELCDEKHFHLASKAIKELYSDTQNAKVAIFCLEMMVSKYIKTNKHHNLVASIFHATKEVVDSNFVETPENRRSFAVVNSFGDESGTRGIPLILEVLGDVFKWIEPFMTPYTTEMVKQIGLLYGIALIEIEECLSDKNEYSKSLLWWDKKTQGLQGRKA